MAILNEEPETPDTTPQTQKAQSSGGGQLDSINDLLNNFNKLLNNDFVQENLANKMNQGQQRGVMGNGGQQPQRKPRPQAQTQGQPQGQPENNATPQKGGVQNHSPPPNPTPNRGETNEKQWEFDLKEYFHEKVKTSEGREELKTQLEELTQYIDGDTTLDELQKEVVSEEFEEQINQLKEAGML